jgi:hypothetical protein
MNLGYAAFKLKCNNLRWGVFNTNVVKVYQSLHKNIPISRPILQFAKKIFLNKK